MELLLCFELLFRVIYENRIVTLVIFVSVGEEIDVRFGSVNGEFC